jgi:hypothetical protein
MKKDSNEIEFDNIVLNDVREVKTFLKNHDGAFLESAVYLDPAFPHRGSFRVKVPRPKRQSYEFSVDICEFSDSQSRGKSSYSGILSNFP